MPNDLPEVSGKRGLSLVGNTAGGPRKHPVLQSVLWGAFVFPTRKANAREMRADWGETGPKLYANWRAISPRGVSETALLEQHEGVLGTS